jgi:hypothetical protein
MRLHKVFVPIKRLDIGQTRKKKETCLQYNIMYRTLTSTAFFIVVLYTFFEGSKSIYVLM